MPCLFCGTDIDVGRGDLLFEAADNGPDVVSKNTPPPPVHTQTEQSMSGEETADIPLLPEEDDGEKIFEQATRKVNADLHEKLRKQLALKKFLQGKKAGRGTIKSGRVDDEMDDMIEGLGNNANEAANVRKGMQAAEKFGMGALMREMGGMRALREKLKDPTARRSMQKRMGSGMLGVIESGAAESDDAETKMQKVQEEAQEWQDNVQRRLENKYKEMYAIVEKAKTNPPKTKKAKAKLKKAQKELQKMQDRVKAQARVSLRDQMREESAAPLAVPATADPIAEAPDDDDDDFYG